VTLSTSIRVLKETVENMKSRSTEFEAGQMPVSTPELSKSEQGAVPSTTARSRRPKAAVLRGADQQPNAPADEKFHTVEQVAEGLNVSPRTVRRWIQSKALVAHRFGASVRIAESELRTFVARHRCS
jgi:excisionase family DNA binding protein